MNKLKFMAVASLLLASGWVHAQDPCNLDAGASAFSWEQVMSCYTSVPYNQDDLDNAVEFISAARERSDLREVFEEQFGWRAKLVTLGEQTFANDFDMQMALVQNHKEFFNPHWRYRRPWCYTGLVAAFIPFDFGSTVTRAKKGKQQQIVFIESASFRPDLYAEFTGIDAGQYVGMKVVSINGVDALQFFRDFGRNELRFDTNDSENFNEAMQNAAYSMRISHTHDMPPDHGSDTYVLEQANGTQMTVEMPWVFAPRAAFGSWQDPLPSSTAQFQEMCQVESWTSWYANRFQPSPEPSTITSPMGRQAGEQDFVHDLREKRAITQRLRKTYGGNNAVGYFEVPPGNLNLPLIPVVAKNNGAVAYAIDDKATFLRLDDFVQDWKAEVITATDYACANTDRLVIDMRNNGGGYVDQIGWLTGHLFPDRNSQRELNLVGRLLNSNTGRNELVDRMTQHVDYWIGPGECHAGYEPACYLDPDTGQRLTALDWYFNPSDLEVRGGKTESLTREIVFSNDRPEYLPGTDPIACPGKFLESTLVLFTNGTGASAGYFFPEAIRDQSIFVSAGGFIGEPLVSGIARGGAVWGMNGYEAAWEQILIGPGYYGPAIDPLPYLVRDAESYIEQPGIYSRDGNGLTAEAISLGDVRIDVWADSPETDGYVYRKVLSAAQSWKPDRKNKAHSK